MKILDEIKDTKLAHEVAKDRLAEYGRAFYRHRNGEALSSDYRYSSFEIITKSSLIDWEYEAETEYEEGAELIVISLYNRRWADDEKIIFRLRYLDLTVEEALEQEDADVQVRHQIKQEREAARKLESEERQKLARREAYERLREEFEGSNS